jgi:hypothetical protein
MLAVAFPRDREASLLEVEADGEGVEGAGALEDGEGEVAVDGVAVVAVVVAVEREPVPSMKIPRHPWMRKNRPGLMALNQGSKYLTTRRRAWST